MPVLLSYNYQVSFISYDSSIANSYLRLTLGVIRQVCFSSVTAWCICYTVAILGEPSGERNLRRPEWLCKNILKWVKAFHILSVN